MKGIENAFIEKVKEEENVLHALSEFIDDSFEYGHKRIDVILNEKDNKIIIMNDGLPMEGLNDYVDNYTAHIKQKMSRENSIAIFGKGSKTGFIRLGDYANGSSLNVYSKADDLNVTQVVSINMANNKDGKCLSARHAEILRGREVIPFRHGTCMEIVNIDKNVWPHLHGIDAETGEIRNDYEAVIAYCQKTYGRTSEKNGSDLYINGIKMEFDDPCHLKKLGNLLEKDGVYQVDGICYWVTTYQAKNNKTNEVINFKVCYTFLPREYFKEKDINKGSGGYNTLCGYYTYYGDRLMDSGGNANSMFKRVPSEFNTGGCNRVRIAIFTDNNYDFFGIKSTKSMGIKPFKDNINFSTFKIGGKTLYSIMRQDAQSFMLLNAYDRADGTDKHITLEHMEKVCITFSSRKCKMPTLFSKKSLMDFFENSHNADNVSSNHFVNVNEILADKIDKDNFTNRIDNCPFMTDEIKEYVYTALKYIPSNELKEKYIDDMIKKIEKYAKTRNQRIEKQSLCSVGVC